MTEQITRFDVDMDGSMEPAEDGQWVRFADHDTEIEAALKQTLPVIGYINEMDEPILTTDIRKIDLACSGGCTRLYGDVK